MEVIDLDCPKTEKDWQAKKEQVLRYYENPAIPQIDKITRLAGSVFELTRATFDGEIPDQLIRQAEEISCLLRAGKISNEIFDIHDRNIKRLNERLKMLEQTPIKDFLKGISRKVLFASRTISAATALGTYFQVGSLLGKLVHFRDKICS